MGFDEGGAMNVDAILRAKGTAVETVRPDSTVTMAAQRMAALRIGCLVVTDGSRPVTGLCTERDIVRAFAHHGADAALLRVRDIMSTGAPQCTPHDDIGSLMRTMTNRRFRHVPVVSGRSLVGIVSIGDVVKQRLQELEFETSVLRDAYRAMH
jgi:CBS domain-containing protein